MILRFGCTGKSRSAEKKNSHIFPPFWPLDTHYGNVKFYKAYDIPKKDTIALGVTSEEYSLLIDNIWQYDFDPNAVPIPEGKHTLAVIVVDYQQLPSVFIKGNHLVTDDSWMVSRYDNNDQKAASWQFNSISTPPTKYRLATRNIKAVETSSVDQQSILYDFGRESYGYIKLQNWKGRGNVNFYYGESKPEALAREKSLQFNRLKLDFDTTSEFYYQEPKALRYLLINYDQSINPGDVSLDYEYLPAEYRGHFECSDQKLNKIWEVAAHTLHLTMREFMIDGIKRDHWVWSGDAIQSYLMNYYLFFETEVNKRTMIALRGKDPIQTHINTILDYSLYWLISFKDYYDYTGDASFIVEMYPKMKTMMDFILERRNEKGFLQGLPGDWVFIDWADISKEGEISFEQILFEQSLAAMALCSELAGKSAEQNYYRKLQQELRSSIEAVFWDPENEQVLHRRVNDTLSDEVSRHANIFSILGNYFDDKKREKIKENILLNPEITALRTPYMKFYELAALCETGEHASVVKDILNYWGGMLDLGATSFWEEYNPEKSGLEHYAMYGFPFNKSLCHSWGASPIYLFGKYFLGVKPLAPGYSAYEVNPNLGGLNFIKGVVPTAKGDVQVFMDAKTIEVTSEIENGILRFESKTTPKCQEGKIEKNC